MRLVEGGPTKEGVTRARRLLPPPTLLLAVKALLLLPPPPLLLAVKVLLIWISFPAPLSALRRACLGEGAVQGMQKGMQGG